MNICQAIISVGWGGAEAWVYTILKNLRDKGESVSLITNQEMVKYYEDLDDVPIFTIQKLMGHKDIKMTMRDAKLSPNAGVDAVMNIERSLIG